MPRVTYYESTDRVVVHYPVREAEQTITRAEADFIANKQVHVLIAIKFIRTQYKLGLYEAKQIMDTLRTADEKRMRSRFTEQETS